MDSAGGRFAVCAGVSGNTGGRLPPQTWEPRWRCSTRRAGQVLHRSETLHQSDHQAEVQTQFMYMGSRHMKTFYNVENECLEKDVALN